MLILLIIPLTWMAVAAFAVAACQVAARADGRGSQRALSPSGAQLGGVGARTLAQTA